MATLQPAVLGAEQRVGGQRRPRSRNTSSNSAPPFICRSGRASTPGSVHVEQEERDALVRRGVGSVRASRMPRSATRPFEHQTFWPLTTQPSPSRSARVWSDARSEPASGSENSWHHTRSPVMIGRRCSRLLLRVPNASSAPAGEHAADHVEERRHLGQRARGGPRRGVLDASDHGRRTSAGQWMPANPASNSVAARPGPRRRGRAAGSGRSRAARRRGARRATGGVGGEVVDRDHGRKCTDRPQLRPILEGAAVVVGDRADAGVRWWPGSSTRAVPSKSVAG